jgi:TonB family protein
VDDAPDLLARRRAAAPIPAAASATAFFSEIPKGHVMNSRLRTLAIAIATLAVISSAEGACDPRIVTTTTEFPMRSQLRGQEGIVALDLTIDASGHVAATQIAQSSGHRLLDRAARESALNDWQFDVSNCARGDLPINRHIAIEYRNDEYR